MTSLIQLRQVSTKKADRLLLDQLDFTWNTGEHWAITSTEGDLITHFLKVLIGQCAVASGKVDRPFAASYVQDKISAGEVFSFRDLIAYVGQEYTFKNRSNQQNFYYQQRFNSIDAGDTVTVFEYLRDCNKQKGFWSLDKVLELLRLKDLSKESLLKLSNGESKRLAIAVALMQQPKLLIMDQPMTGLDIGTRDTFAKILTEIQQQGVHVLMSAIPSEIPDCLTHIGDISQGKLWVKTKGQTQKIDFRLELHTGFNHQHLLPKLLKSKSVLSPYKELVHLQRVSVRYGDKVILRDVSWQIKPNERWLLKGPNGAGKSTLISLIIGEHPQAYANNIILFDTKRGTGESIWDVKRPTGFVAPELIRFFPRNQTVWKVLLSGFFDTMGLFKKTSVEQEEQGILWLKLLDLEEKKDFLMHQLTLGEQRFLLLARALIKKPDLLIVDEGAQGLDIYQRVKFKRFLEQIFEETNMSLIYVSHYQEDIPKSVTKTFELK